MDKNIIAVIVGVVVALVIVIAMGGETIEYVEVPVEIEVKVPVIEKEFDTIYLPSPIKQSKPQIDSTYYNEYAKLKDSISKNKAYKDAITIREYKPRFEDDSIIIDVYAKTRGTLLESQISYKTKPRTILLDTTLTIKVPRRTQIYVGGTIYLPATNSRLEAPGMGPTLMILNKKQSKIINLGYDAINKVGVAGVVFKL